MLGCPDAFPSGFMGTTSHVARRHPCCLCRSMHDLLRPKKNAGNMGLVFGEVLRLQGERILTLASDCGIRYCARTTKMGYSEINSRNLARNWNVREACPRMPQAIKEEKTGGAGSPQRHL